MLHQKQKAVSIAVILMSLVLFSATSALASGGHFKESKPAIVLANFGTTVPSAVKALINIQNKVKEAYPDTEVRITFTSNIVRSVWKERREDPEKWLGMGIPEEVLYVKNIIQTMGDLQEEGFRTIVVQPTHMFYMEQSHDLNAYIRGLNNIHTMKPNWKPFERIVMGRPALGMPGVQFNYHEDVQAVIKTLKADVEHAKKENATLIYMGHGNEHWSTGIYAETQKAMRAAYPGVTIYIGVVEGAPALEDFMSHLAYAKTQKVILRPFMITAGDHATNDMAGPEEDSWASILKAKGYEVMPVLEGLGSNDAFAAILVDHIADAAKMHGITLH